MKAVIMCAGKGTRMLPLTERTQKVLIPINGKPFLYYLLKNLEKAGVEDVLLVVGHLKQQFAPFLQEYGFHAETVEQLEQHGTAHAVLHAERWVDKGSFLVMGGDNLWSVQDIKQTMIRDTFTYITAKKHRNPEKYGVLVEKDGYLTDMVEKPKAFVSDLINTGLYKFTPEIFSAIRQIRKSDRGEYELPDAIKILSAKKKVRVLKVRGYWKDLGCPEDIPKLEEFLVSFE
jgi:dTDP-glucose pyrophosphorylase